VLTLISLPPNYWKNPSNTYSKNMKRRERNNSLLEFIEGIQGLSPRYLPLPNSNTCPYCRYAFYKTLNTAAENVSEVEYLNCHGILYFDGRMKLKITLNFQNVEMFYV